MLQAFASMLPNDDIAKLACLLLTAGAVGRYMFFRKAKLFLRTPPVESGFGFFIAWLAILIFSQIRSNTPDATVAGTIMEILTMVLFLMSFIAGTGYRFTESKDPEMTAYELVFGVYFVSAVVVIGMTILYIVNYNSAPSAGIATVAAAFHIPLEKKPLIMGGEEIHPNTVGIYSSAVFVMGVMTLLIYKTGRAMRFFLYLALIAEVAFMLAADSRGSIGNAVIALGVIFMIQKFRVFWLPRLLVLVVPFLPFVLIFVLSSTADSAFMKSFSRSEEENDLADGNSRGLIWEYCFNELKDAKPKHIFGYGTYGQYGAGLSQKYSVEVKGEGTSPLMVTHNMFFQSFMDAGYVGSLLFILSLLYAINCLIYLYKKGFKPSLALLAYLIYFVLSGTSESTYGLYNAIYFYITLSVMIASFVLRGEWSVVVGPYIQQKQLAAKANAKG